MRTFFSSLITLFLVLTLNLTPSFAQTSPQWDLPEGVRTRLGKGTIEEIAYSPDGSRLAVGGGIGIWVYDANTNVEMSLIGGHTGDVTSIAFSSDGKTLASGSVDDTVRLWDVETSTLKHTLTEHTRDVLSIAFSPDGKTLASGSRDGTRLWDVATGTPKNTLTEHTGGVLSVAYSPDGSTVASGSEDGTVRLSDVATSTLKNTLREPTGVVTDVAYSPDGNTIVTGSFQKARLWDVATSTLKDTLTGHTDLVGSVAYSPDGNTIASGSDDGTVRLWDAATSTLKNTLTGHTSPVLSVAFSPDGNTLATGSWGNDGALRLWDAATSTLKHTLRGHKNTVESAVYSPDGKTLASVGRDHTVRLWDVETNTLRTTLTEHTDPVFSVAFSPDGKTLVSGGADVRVWDVETGTLKNRFTSQGHSVAFSPDGNMIASGGFQALNLWDAATGAHLKAFEARSGIKSVAFSRDGKTLASGSWNEPEVRLWDVATGTPKDTLTGHTQGVRSVVFSPDGNTLASGSDDETVRLWDVATSTLKDTLTGHTLGVHSVAYSADGTTLASGSWDGTALLWGQTPATGPLTFTPSIFDDQTFEVGTPVNVTLPSATGGTAPYTYTLDPIPAGLQFDTATQLLSGTSTTATPATSVTYTATDAAGATASLTFNITVTDAPATGITFIPNAIDDLTLTVNTPMDPLYLPLAAGGTSPYTYTLDPLPVGLSFDAATQLLSGTPTTVGTMPAVYIATDATGASAALNFIIQVIEDDPGGDALDVNGDGQVSVIDLAMVALFYGTQVPAGFNLPADVNTDGVVNLADLAAVAQAIDAAGGGANQLSLQEVELALLIAAEQAVELEAVAGAPGRAVASVSVRLAAQNVSDALAAARTDVRFQKGFAVLEAFLALLTELTAIPETTALLPNYPNPFNPETWIPYHLSKDAEVKLTIYDMRGVAVRELVFGHQPAGVYESRGRAVYWDGRNQHGEPVASGVYFYTLTAGDFTATRKLLIAK